MKIIIIGAGSAGRNLAAKLCGEKHDVVIIDKQASVLATLDTKLDVLTIQGHGSSPEILRKAGVERADMIVALSSNDEVNMVACAFAACAGVKQRIARVSHEDYLCNGVDGLPEQFGIDLAVNPQSECARELVTLFQVPGAKEVVDMPETRVQVVGFVLNAESKLIGQPLMEFPRQDLLESVRFVMREHDGKLELPRGDTVFEAGDHIYVIGEASRINELLEEVCPRRHRIKRVVIAGGGGLGLALARRLDVMDIETVVIEHDENIAEACADQLRNTLVIHADALEGDVLNESRLNSSTAFIAATGIDERNIISCLMAKKNGAGFTCGRVTRPEHVPIIEELGLLDRAVSPNLSLMNAILSFLRGHDVHGASLLHRLPGELLEVVLSESSRWTGKPVRNLSIPRGAIITMVRRGDTMLVPSGDLTLCDGDRLVVFALPKTIRKLHSILEK